MSEHNQGNALTTAPPWHHSYLTSLLSRLASLRLTLRLFILLLGAIALYASELLPSEWILVIPLLLLALNLAAAIFSSGLFYDKPALLIFHLALLMLLLFIALGRMSYFRADVEVTSGSEFNGQPLRHQAGPWHHFAIHQLRFRLRDFSVAYAPGRQRMETTSHISWSDAEGRPHQALVGDHHPLILAGYRFYTTHNKGFAPYFSWRGNDGRHHSGSVHLPAFPVNEFKQSSEWTIPGTHHTLWTQLDTDETLIDPASSAQFRLPRQHRLIVRTANGRHELQPGDRLRLDDGVLTYQELRSWMGFRVFYDWTLPWLLAAALLAALSLGWHYWRRVAAKPWLNNEETT